MSGTSAGTAPSSTRQRRRAARRAALRIARRDALRAKGRSALVVVMVALPVMALVFAAVAVRTAQLDPDEVADRALGLASYSVQGVASPGEAVVQTPDGQSMDWVSPPDADADPVDPVDPTTLVPRGAETLSEAVTSVQVRTAGGVGLVDWTEAPAADWPGRWDVESGRAPSAPDEVLVTPELAERTGVSSGPLEVTQPEATVEVVGVVRRVDTPGSQEVVGLPGSLGEVTGDPAQSPPVGTVWVLGDPLDWDGVQALNAQGALVVSRAVLLDPPPDSAVPYYDRFGTSDGPSTDELLFFLLVGGLGVTLAALEVVLLAGAAFAVGARRQARSLALVVAAGGEPQDARRVVLAGGVVLGAAGGLVGLVVGALVALAVPPLARLVDVDVGSYDLRPQEVVPVALLGVVTGVLAAVVPARTAARQDVVAVLAGRRGQVAVPRRVPVVGLVLLAAGIAASAVGSGLALAQDRGEGGSTASATLAAGLVAVGAVLAVVALVVLSPAVVALAGRAARFLPLVPRLALRDAARYRSRSAPAIAAVLVGVTGSVALSVVVTAYDDADRRSYQPRLPDRYAAVLLESAVPDGNGTYRSEMVPPSTAERALGTTLPVVSSTAVASPWSCRSDSCGSFSATVPEENTCPADAAPGPDATDWRYAYSTEPYTPGLLWDVVADLPTARRVVGHGLPADAAATLAAGGVVTADRGYVADGRMTFDVFTAEDLAVQPPPGDATWEGPTPSSQVTVPATWVPSGLGPAVTIYSPEAAARLGSDPVPTMLLLELDRLPTQAEEDAAAAALGQVGLDEYALVVERGYVSEYGIGLLALVAASAVITLGAAAVATGLALADARPDHATLAAVGAPPRLRRGLAAGQALVVTVLGTLLGVAAGLVPGIAFVESFARFRLVVPWTSLAAVVVLVPALAGGAAWLLTRSRLPMTRREAL